LEIATVDPWDRWSGLPHQYEYGKQLLDALNQGLAGDIILEVIKTIIGDPLKECIEPFTTA
jgi:hypothetical protein